MANLPTSTFPPLKLLVALLLVSSSLSFGFSSIRKFKVGDLYPLCLAMGETFDHNLKSVSTKIDPTKLQGYYRMAVNLYPETGTVCRFKDFKLTYNKQEDVLDFDEICYSAANRIGSFKKLGDNLNAIVHTLGSLKPTRKAGYAKMYKKYGKHFIKHSNFWILDISEDYSHILIGEPCYRKAYIYVRADEKDEAKTKVTDIKRIKDLIQLAANKGYKVLQ